MVCLFRDPDQKHEPEHLSSLGFANDHPESTNRGTVALLLNRFTIVTKILQYRLGISINSCYDDLVLTIVQLIISSEKIVTADNSWRTADNSLMLKQVTNI